MTYLVYQSDTMLSDMPLRAAYTEINDQHYMIIENEFEPSVPEGATDCVRIEF